jgi:hypothetical protein
MVGAGAEIFEKLEPEPKLLTGCSRSRTKMDRIRNTVFKGSTGNSLLGPNLCSAYR